MTFLTLDASMFPDDVAGSDNVARANCLLNAFRVAVNNSLSTMAMVDGVVDEFEDETGVDTATSTDETYDATDDYYSNPGGEGYISYATGTVEDSGSTSFGYNGHVAANAFTGVQHPAQASSAETGNYTNNTALGKNWGASKLVTKAMVYSRAARTELHYNNSCDIQLQGWTGSAWTDLSSAQNVTSAGSGTYTLTYAGSTEYTKHRVLIDNLGGSEQTGVGEVEFFELATPANMVLVSEASVAEAVPDEAFLCVWQEDVDAVTENTDLLAYVTRDADAGTPEWTQVTLTEEATLDTGRILTGSVDISGAASDVDMAWKLMVANNKEQRIHGVGLSWS
jgi:hypothetical protein